MKDWIVDPATKFDFQPHDFVPFKDKKVCEYVRSLSGKDPLEFALSGGEDYELLFTISPDAEKDLTINHFVIGEIVRGEGVSWQGTDKDYLGFRHF